MDNSDAYSRNKSQKEMKERPILMSTEMVKAILAGRKTQTRRVINPQPDEDCYYELSLENGILLIDYNQGDKNPRVKCPYGEKGDLLWVRESFFLEKYFNGLGEGFIPLFKANYDGPVGWNWKPSIHMPKWSARIWVQIESIWYERLEEISQHDAIAEGIQMTFIHDDIRDCLFKNYINDGSGSLMPCQSYRSLWKSINGEESWNKNPWVWAIAFKVLSTTGRPTTQPEDPDFEPSEEENDFEPCNDCDLPDACDDFGCAIKNGVRRPPSTSVY